MPNEHVSMTLDVLPGTFGGIIAAIAGFNELVSSATTLAGAVGQSTSAVESMALTAGVALAGAGAAAASAAGEFDRSMKLVQAVSGQSAAEINVLTQRANEFTSQYKIGIDKVTEGLQTLGRAGLGSLSTQLEVIETGFQASKLSGLELNDVLEKIVQTTSLLGGDINSTSFGGQVTDITNKMLATSMTAPITMNDVVQTLSYSGGTAAAAGINIYNEDALYDYLGTISAFAQKGVTGSMAGTALRAFFTKPASQDTSVKDAFASIGLSADDLWKDGGNQMRKVSEQIQIIHDAMNKKNLSTLDQIEVWGKIVGNKMGQQMMKLDENAIRNVTEKIEESTNATELVNNAMRNYASEVTALGEQAQVVWRNFGQAALIVFEPLVKGAKLLMEILSGQGDGFPFAQQALYAGIILLISQIVLKLRGFFSLVGAIARELRGLTSNFSSANSAIQQDNNGIQQMYQKMGLTEFQAEKLAKTQNTVTGNIRGSNTQLTLLLGTLNEISAVMKSITRSTDAMARSFLIGASNAQFNRFYQGKGMPRVASEYMFYPTTLGRQGGELLQAGMPLKSEAALLTAYAQSYGIDQRTLTAMYLNTHEYRDEAKAKGIPTLWNWARKNNKVHEVTRTTGDAVYDEMNKNPVLIPAKKGDGRGYIKPSGDRSYASKQEMISILDVLEYIQKYLVDIDENTRVTASKTQGTASTNQTGVKPPATQNPNAVVRAVSTPGGKVHLYTAKEMQDVKDAAAKTSAMEAQEAWQKEMSKNTSPVRAGAMARISPISDTGKKAIGEEVSKATTRTMYQYNQSPPRGDFTTGFWNSLFGRKTAALNAGQGTAMLRAGASQWARGGMLGMFIDWKGLGEGWKKAGQQATFLGRATGRAGALLGSTARMFGPLEAGMLAFSIASAAYQKGLENYNKKLTELQSNLSKSIDSFDKITDEYNKGYKKNSEAILESQEKVQSSWDKYQPDRNIGDRTNVKAKAAEGTQFVGGSRKIENALITIAQARETGSIANLDDTTMKMHEALLKIRADTDKLAEQQADPYYGTEGEFTRFTEGLGALFDPSSWNDNMVQLKSSTQDMKDGAQLFMATHSGATWGNEDSDIEGLLGTSSLGAFGINRTSAFEDFGLYENYLEHRSNALNSKWSDKTVAMIQGSKATDGHDAELYRQFARETANLSSKDANKIAIAINKNEKDFKYLGKLMLHENANSGRIRNYLTGLGLKTGLTNIQLKQAAIIQAVSDLRNIAENSILPQIKDTALYGYQTAMASYGGYNAGVASVNAEGAIYSAAAAIATNVAILTDNALTEQAEKDAASYTGKLDYQSAQRYISGQGNWWQNVVGSLTISESDKKKLQETEDSRLVGLYMAANPNSNVDAAKKWIEERRKAMVDEKNITGTYYQNEYIEDTLLKGITGQAYKQLLEEYENSGTSDDDGSGKSGSGSGDKDKTKDDGSKRNWVNLAICNKKEIPKLNVNLFKKPPNFTILNRNFKLRDVNVNTADDAKSIQNAVKNSIIEIQNRSNPKIIQDDAAEYDPLAATEGNTLPTGTKKTE